jgi:DNA-binding Lrp family transcriptional regulator
MVQAFVLMHTDIGKPEAVAGAVRRIEGVIRADSVTGPYDVIAVVTAADFPSLGKGALPQIQTVDGVTRTITCQVMRIE